MRRLGLVLLIVCSTVQAAPAQRPPRSPATYLPTWVTDDHAVPRDVPQALRTFTDTLRLVNPAARQLPATYVLTLEPGKTPDPFQRYADRAAARGWRVYQLEADHVPERSAPAALVALLERIR